MTQTLPQVWTEGFRRETMEELRLAAARRFRRFQLPSTASEWQSRRRQLLEVLRRKLVLEVDHDLPLDCRWTGEVACAGYAIRQLYYQSRPGVYVTGSLYVPEGAGPFPGVAVLHGHWAQGHLAPKIQAMGHILAQRGYVVLSVDAFGSGERCTEHGVFEYHGGQIGGRLLNVGESLMGFQVVDNMRAVDLLQSLPFVDGSRIGATGGSGGGNQTMYLAAFDERVLAAAPVVSVGTYQSYVGGANCICELLPDGLEICEESSLLALAAPRALLICNAMHDINPTFHVPEMLRSQAEARKVYAALGVPGKLATLAFNAEHSYPDEVRSAVLGFFDYHLCGRGACLPAPLPAYQEQPEEKLMVFARGARPLEVCSIEDYVARRAAALRSTARGTAAELRSVLRLTEESLAWLDDLYTEQGWRKLCVTGTRGRMLPLLWREGRSGRCRVMASSGGKPGLAGTALLEAALASDDAVLLFDHYGTGECGYVDTGTRRDQHLLSRSLMWLGRRLMGEWVQDWLLVAAAVRRLCPGVRLVWQGFGDSGVAALFAVVCEGGEDVAEVVMAKSAATLAQPGETMACCIPDILIWGDLDHAASLAPCPVRRED